MKKLLQCIISFFGICVVSVKSAALTELQVRNLSVEFYELADLEERVTVTLKTDGSHLKLRTIIVHGNGFDIMIPKSEFGLFMFPNLKSVGVTRNDESEEEIYFINLDFRKNTIDGWEGSGEPCRVRFKIKNGEYLYQTVMVHTEHRILIRYKEYGSAIYSTELPQH